MTRLMTSALALTLTTGTAFAGGLDRSGQPVNLLFEEGNYVEFSIGRVMPEATGTDATVPQQVAPA